jgi:hypothetical protein
VTDPTPGPAGNLPKLLDDAYAAQVDLDVAARHLWRLHHEAERSRSGAAGAGRRAHPRRVLVAVLAAGLLAVASGGALAADPGLLPGDALYGVKRGVERVQLLLPRSDESEARLHLRLAQARLAEARRAAEDRPEVLARLFDEAVRAVRHAEAVGGPKLAAQVAQVKARADQDIAQLAPQLQQHVPRAVADGPSAPPGATEPVPARPAGDGPVAALAAPPTAMPSPVRLATAAPRMPAETATATVPTLTDPEPDPGSETPGPEPGVSGR